MSDVKCKHCNEKIEQYADGMFYGRSTASRCIFNGKSYHEPADPPQTGTAEQSKTDEECVECNRLACGVCENCGHSICPDHESGKFEDVCTCKDSNACSKRLAAKESAPSVLEGTLPPLIYEESDYLFAKYEELRSLRGDADIRVRERQLLALTAELAAEKEKREELETLFDLQWDRSVEADKLWRQAHPGNDAVKPDLGDLLSWLMKRAERAEAENKALREALQNTGRAVGETYCWCRTQAWDCGTPSCERARAALAIGSGVCGGS